MPKTGFVNPNYPGFQHLANTEQTGFPRDLSLDSLDEGSNPLTSVSELTSTPEEQEIIHRVQSEGKGPKEQKIDDRAKAIWDEVRELSSKVPCCLEEIISEKSKESWKEIYEEDPLKDDTGIDVFVENTETNCKDSFLEKECLQNFEESQNHFTENKLEEVTITELSQNERDIDETEKKDLEKGVENIIRKSDSNNNEESKVIEGVNKLDEIEVKEIYSKPKLNIPLEEEEIKPNNMEVVGETWQCPEDCLRPIVKAPECPTTEIQRPTSLKALECARPAVAECVRPVPKYPESCRSTELPADKSIDCGKPSDTNRLEKGEREAAPQKKEKTEINMNVKKMTSTQRLSPRTSKGIY